MQLTELVVVSVFGTVIKKKREKENTKQSHSVVLEANSE